MCKIRERTFDFYGGVEDSLGLHCFHLQQDLFFLFAYIQSPSCNTKPKIEFTLF